MSICSNQEPSSWESLQQNLQNDLVVLSCWYVDDLRITVDEHLNLDDDIAVTSVVIATFAYSAHRLCFLLLLSRVLFATSSVALLPGHGRTTTDRVVL